MALRRSARAEGSIHYPRTDTGSRRTRQLLVRCQFCPRLTGRESTLNLLTVLVHGGLRDVPAVHTPRRVDPHALRLLQIPAHIPNHQAVASWTTHGPPPWCDTRRLSRCGVGDRPECGTTEEERCSRGPRTIRRRTCPLDERVTVPGRMRVAHGIGGRGPGRRKTMESTRARAAPAA